VGFLLFSALLHAYVGARLVPALTAWPWGAVLLVVLLVASSALIPIGFLARRAQGEGRIATALAWAGLLCMGLFSSLFVLTLLRDAVLAVLLLAEAFDLFGLTAKAVAESSVASGAGVVVLALAITLIGLRNARRTADVVRVDIPIENLPDALHGFTIAQISDVHVGPTIRRPYVHAIVEAVNELGADMVAVTGDLVDGSVAKLAHHVAPLAQLKSRHGTYFVTGNHEYYSGVHAWLAELERLDVRVLLNEHVVLEHGEAMLVVAGVADRSAHHFDPTHRSDPVAALAGAPDEAAIRVLLAHQPRSAVAAARAGFHLQLSGHTHGGQFFPWNLLIGFFQPFAAGLHRLEDLWIYTSRGTGYWGPPKRLGAPSEITFVRLVPPAPQPETRRSVASIFGGVRRVCRITQ
jgi:predicted MPP superfamily phosphohydrolase